MKKALTILLLMEVLLVRASAVPLFGETAGTIKHGVLTLYKDHQNPNKVYFFPNSTEFLKSTRGFPLFNFVYWGLNKGSGSGQVVGAYMTMSSRLSMDKDQKLALQNYIASNPHMEVAVLPIKSSVIGLSTTAQGGPPLKNLFTEFNFSKVGGRAEDEIGINAVLTETGARAFRALLLSRSEGSLIKFDYCYKIEGYGPNMDASVSVDMKRVYDIFQAKASFGGWFWNARSIRMVTETLRDNRDVRITMNGGDATEMEVLTKISEVITARLFTPELANSPNRSAVPQASSNAFFTFNASSLNQSELKNETWHFVRRDLVEREFCTAISIKDLQPYLSELVTSADE